MWAPRFGAREPSGSRVRRFGHSWGPGFWESSAADGVHRMLEVPHCCNLLSLSFQASQNIILFTYTSLQSSDRDPRIVLISL